MSYMYLPHSGRKYTRNYLDVIDEDEIVQNTTLSRSLRQKNKVKRKIIYSLHETAEPSFFPFLFFANIFPFLGK